jgi:hypothetical protein
VTDLAIERVYDRGVVHQMRILPDKILAVARWAVADQAMRYINTDGSIRYETPKKQDLFSDISRHSAAMATLTLDHTEPGNPPSPENYKEVSIGSAGDNVFEEIVGGKSLLSTLIVIKDRAAMDAVIDRQKAGRSLAVSPGYFRKPILDASDSTGKSYLQTDRNHFELAVLRTDDGRGGDLVRIMDSADKPINLWQFDPAQANDDWLAMMSLDSVDSESIGRIQRLLQGDGLSPPPIYLPINKNKTMTLIPIKLGDKTVQVAPESAQDAMDYAKRFAEITKELDETRADAAKFREADGKLYAMSYELTQLRSSMQDSKAVAAQTAKAVQRYQETGMILDSLKKTGQNLDKAEKALSAYDADLARKEIVAVIKPELVAKDSEAIDQFLDGYMSKQSNQDAGFYYSESGSPGRMQMPSEYLAAGAEQVSYRQLVAGSTNGGLPVGTSYLSSDDGWKTF